MRSSIGIHIEAPPATVFELSHDVSRWSELLPHYARSTVMARAGDRVLVQMVALRWFGRVAIPVAWRAVCHADDADPDDLRLHFRHVRGATRGMVVTWHIRSAGTEAEVANHGAAVASEIEIVHEFERPLPVLGRDAFPRFVDRVFTRPIAGRTLATFKRLAKSRHPRKPAETNNLV